MVMQSDIFRNACAYTWNLQLQISPNSVTSRFDIISICLRFLWGLYFSIFSFLCSILKIIVCPFSLGHCIVSPSSIYGFLSLFNIILATVLRNKLKSLNGIFVKIWH